MLTCYRLIITIDVLGLGEFRTTRTLPFIPVEGLTLLIPADDDEPFPIELGAPTYCFERSAFIADHESNEYREAVTEQHSLVDPKKLVRERLAKYGFHPVS